MANNLIRQLPRIPHKLSRVYIDTNIALDSTVLLNPINSHHLVNVMRLKPGSMFRGFNSENGEYLFQVESINSGNSRRRDKDSMCISVSAIKQLRLPHKSSSLCTNLYVSPIRKTNMKRLIEMATELGVSRIVPVVFQNTNHSFTASAMRPLAVSGAEQSERLTVPLVEDPISLGEILQSGMGGDPVLLCRERADTSVQNILSCASNLLSTRPSSLGIMVGPEGGYTDGELKTLSQVANIHAVTLSDTVLRTETAVAAALAGIRMLNRDI